MGQGMDDHVKQSTEEYGRFEAVDRISDLEQHVWAAKQTILIVHNGVYGGLLVLVEKVNDGHSDHAGGNGYDAEELCDVDAFLWSSVHAILSVLICGHG